MQSQAKANTNHHWHQKVGSQRDWVWRGWQTRYTYYRGSRSDSQPTTPVILLHGFGASIGHWRHNLEVLGQQHTVYALDMLGFGASRKARAEYSVNLWVEQVYDFWRTFIRQPVVLIGNSIGSLVCIAAAAAHPEMVKSIVMMSLPDPSLEMELIPQWLQPVVVGVKGFVAARLFPLVSQPWFVRKWAGFAYPNGEAVTDELIDILVGPARERGSAYVFCAVFQAMSNPQSCPNVKTVLPTLDIPILLIWGKQDRMIPPALARPSQFCRLNSKLTLVELEGLGHCPHDEAPEQVNQILLEWIEAIAASSSEVTEKRTEDAATLSPHAYSVETS